MELESPLHTLGGISYLWMANQHIGGQWANRLSNHSSTTSSVQYDRVQETCVEDMADFACGGGNPCMNGGECQKAVQAEAPASDGNNGDDDDDDDEDEKKVFVCKCLPAFQGELCEVDVDPCATGEGVKTCMPFKCIRMPDDPYNGFK